MSDDNIIRPKHEDGFFIGWSPEVSTVDRRFLLAAAAGLTLGGGVSAAALASRQQGPGEGSWNQGEILDWVGMVSADPYPLIRTETDGEVRTALLLCMTKCGVRRRITSASDEPTRVTGSLIRRGRHTALAVTDGLDWMGPAENPAAVNAAALAEPQPVSLGEATFLGEILDSKCWFGAMRPGEGQTHKACASLCIRYGVPPALFVRDQSGREHAFIMTDPDGGFIPPEEAFLSLVADPVEVTGELVALGDLVTIRLDPSQIRRV